MTLISVLNIVYFFVKYFRWLADYYNFKCGSEGMLDWFTGEPWRADSNNATAVAMPNDDWRSCRNLHYLDRIILFIEIFCMFVKNCWFGYRIVTNSSNSKSKDNYFVDLSDLQEFMLPEPLTFVSETNNSTTKRWNQDQQKKKKQHTSPQQVMPVTKEGEIKFYFFFFWKIENTFLNCFIFSVDLCVLTYI